MPQERSCSYGEEWRDLAYRWWDNITVFYVSTYCSFHTTCFQELMFSLEVARVHNLFAINDRSFLLAQICSYNKSKGKSKTNISLYSNCHLRNCFCYKRLANHPSNLNFCTLLINRGNRTLVEEKISMILCYFASLLIWSNKVRCRNPAC